MNQGTEVKPYTSVGLHNDVCVQLREYGVREIVKNHGSENAGEVVFKLHKDHFTVSVNYGGHAVQWSESFDMDKLVDGLHIFNQIKRKMTQEKYNKLIKDIVKEKRFDENHVTKRGNNEL